MVIPELNGLREVTDFSKLQNGFTYLAVRLIEANYGSDEKQIFNYELLHCVKGRLIILYECCDTAEVYPIFEHTQVYELP